MAALILVGSVLIAALLVAALEWLGDRYPVEQVWWCKTHRCRDGECGVIGEHTVTLRHARVKGS